MTEAEWLASKDPDGLVTYLYYYRRPSARKFRLFACACFGVLEGGEWQLKLDGQIQEVVEVARRLADGTATHKELSAARRLAAKWVHASERFFLAARFTVLKSARGAAHAAAQFIPPDLAQMGSAHERDELLARANGSLAAVVRECFGSLPFRPVTFSPSWRTDTVLSLARQMYESRDFSAMPILADALQDAGCDNEDVLAHCRGEGPHVRGCWVVDLVLGKE